MKKALIVLLILGVAGGVFAQDITWSGSVGTGVFFQVGDKTDDDVIVFADDDDDGVPIIAKLGAVYDAGDWGLKLGTVGKWNEDEGYMKFHNAYGWMNFIDGILNVKAGMIDDGVWGTGEYIDTGFATGGGMRIEVKPITGLNFGVFFSWPNGGAGPNEIKDWFQTTAFGFEYDAGTWKANASAKLYSEVDAERGDTDFDITAGFGFYGIDRLSIYFGFLGEGLIEYDDPLLKFGLNVGYQFTDALSFGLEAGLIMQDGISEVSAKPSVEYAVNDNISLGAEVLVAMRDIGDDLGFAELSPAVWGKYTLGGSWMKAGYGFNMITKDYGDTLDHTIKLVFGYSF